MNQQDERDFWCLVGIPSMLPRALADHLPWALGLRSWCGHLSCPEPEAELTICLRSAIREGLEALRSSLLGVSSAGSGVRSASSPRSAVCKADSTSSDLTASTGDSHTTWIVRPGDKTVGGKTIPRHVLYSGSCLSPHPHACCRLEPRAVSARARRQEAARHTTCSPKTWIQKGQTSRPLRPQAAAGDGFRRGKRPAR